MHEISEILRNPRGDAGKLHKFNCYDPKLKKIRLGSAHVPTSLLERANVSRARRE